MSDFDWNELQAALSALECDVSPAGVHGQMAALACRLQAPPDDFGLAVSQSDDTASADLKRAFADINKQLESADMSFSPLLPDDEQVLWRRLEGLGEWAECFAFGLSLGGGFDPDKLTAEGHECLQHLLEISRIDPDDEQATGPEAEEAYNELVEFLRVAVMTLYVELRTLDIQQKAAASKSSTPPLAEPNDLGHDSTNDTLH